MRDKKTVRTFNMFAPSPIQFIEPSAYFIAFHMFPAKPDHQTIEMTTPSDQKISLHDAGRLLH
jgi:hypothetical protein